MRTPESGVNHRPPFTKPLAMPKGARFPYRALTVSDCVKSQAKIAALADRQGWPERIISLTASSSLRTTAMRATCFALPAARRCR
jgi:hypothetical protein